jgi:endonuclease/exonuclease/phosphatase (EEP) superfamily protein YafD
VTSLLVAATVGLVTATGLAFGRDWRLVILSNFRLHLIAVAAVFAAVALTANIDLLMRGGVLVPLLFVIASNLILMLKSIRASRETVAGPRLRIAFANLLASNLAHQRAIDWVRAEKPDVFIVAEAEGLWRPALAALNEQFPFSSPSQKGDVVVFSRLPFESEPVDLYPGIGHAVFVGIAGLTVVGVHTASPQTALYVRELERMLATMAARLADTAAPVVAIGDFNASPWTNAVRRFQASTGLRCGPGAWIGSYPAEIADRRIPTWLAIPIDIAMAGRGARVVRRRHGPRIGSDHWPILAEVVVAKRPEKPANSAP